MFSQITNTRKWRFTERDSLDNALLLYEEANYKVALPVLEQIYLNHPKEEFIKYLYGICCLYRPDKYDRAVTALSEVYAVNTNIDQIEFDLARAYHYNYKFDEALEMVRKHLAYKRIRPDEKAKGELLKKYVVNAKYYNSVPTKAKVNAVASGINTAEDEYLPVISADESVMVFNYVGSKSKGGKQNLYSLPDANGFYNPDIYLSQKQNNKFQDPVALDNINTNASDVVISLSQDAQVLYTYRDVTDGHGDIYVSYLTNNGYSQPVKLKGKVNTYSWEGGCSLSPDGRTLYFSSERSGGFGGKDIYKAKLMADSTWGGVVNLGDSINTSFDEEAPFIHADGTTLFYSSKCLKSTGGYDVFKASMDLRDSTFKKTINVGYPINTPDDDIYFVLAANGTNGYYSSGRKGGAGLKDIYTIETGFDVSKGSIFLLKGSITKNKEVIDADIKVENTSTNAVIKRARSNKGKYVVSLPANGQYKITYGGNKLPEQIIKLSTIGINGYVEKNQNIDLDVRPDTARVVVTPTVAIAKVTTTVNTTSTISVAKAGTVAATSTVAVVKNTASVSATPTVAVVKTNSIVSTPTINGVKANTVSATPTVTVVKTTPTINTTSTVNTTKTNSVTTTATQVASVKVTAPTVISSNTTGVVIVNSPTVPSTQNGIARPANMTMENFVPLTPAQEKIRLYTEKYPDVSADSLDFRIQIAAFKNPKVYSFPHLKDCGKLENLLLEDGITRLTIGGSFKTLRAAYEHNKKVVIAGQNDAFVTVIYKRRRLALEELENMGIFKKK
ncbi:MAG: PD40 domain-containing protein [Bacteroidetes bacterium]|nr:PD40 domain-containing protein [Bacteroidota bacterium]